MPLVAFGAAILAVKHELAKRLYRSRGRDEGDEGLGSSARTRDHDHIIFGIVTEFVGSG